RKLCFEIEQLRRRSLDEQLRQRAEAAGRLRLTPAVKQARTVQLNLAEKSPVDYGVRALMQSLFTTNRARRLLFVVLCDLSLDNRALKAFEQSFGFRQRETEFFRPQLSALKPRKILNDLSNSIV